MPAAARVSDKTNHPGMIVAPGVNSVIIDGLSAAVLGTRHICGLPPLAGPHSPTTIVKGSKTVLIGGMPAARLGDSVGCSAIIISGARDVLIG